MVIDGKQGLLPSNKEISYKCSCPDWASMCKHVAAVIYGIGARLDHQPELLFLLRGVDHSELIQTEVVSAVLAGGSDRRSRRQAPVDVQALFEVEIEGSSETQGVEPQGQKKAKTATTKTKAATAKAKTATTKTKADKPSAKVEKAQKPAKAESKASSAAKVKPLAKAESKSKASSAPKAAPALAQPFHATPRTIASLRQQLGLSASAMARALGVTPVTVSRWENSPTALKLNAKNLAQLQTLRDGGTPSL